MGNKSKGKSIEHTPNVGETKNTPAPSDLVPSVQYLQESFSGPLPSPAILKAYDLASPGLAERIIAQWETQSGHRRSLERSVIEGDNKRANWGLASATLVSLSVLGVAGVLAMQNHAVAAVLAGVNIVALASVFVYGTNSRKQERVEKAKVMTGQIEKRSDTP